MEALLKETALLNYSDPQIQALIRERERHDEDGCNCHPQQRTCRKSGAAF